MLHSLVSLHFIGEMFSALYFLTPLFHVDPLMGFSHRLTVICVVEVSRNFRNTYH